MAALILSGFTNVTLAGKPSFHGVGMLPGDVRSFIHELSADGATAVGRSATATYGEVPFRWTENTGILALDPVPGYSNWGLATAVSADGSVVAGTIAGGRVGVRWVKGIPHEISNLPGTYDHPRVYPLAASADGSVIVGRAGTGGTAFRWTPVTGSQDIGFMVKPYVASYATAVSGDGNVVAGYVVHDDSNRTHEAFHWTPDGGVQLLGVPEGVEGESEAWGISADGSVIVGIHDNSVFRWTAASGRGDLGPVPGMTYLDLWAADCTADGSTVVGFARGSGPDFAWIWDEVHGMRVLRDVLEDECMMDIGDWNLDRAVAISDDGMTIAGNGHNPHGYDEGWVVRLPEPATLVLLAAGVVCVWMRRRQGTLRRGSGQAAGRRDRGTQT